MGQDYWLFHEYSFNTVLFKTYVKEAKKYENSQNEDAINKNEIYLDEINNLIRLQHNNLTEKNHQLLQKQIEEIAIDVNSKFVQI